jgi:addiction module HigA family antidote
MIALPNRVTAHPGEYLLEEFLRPLELSQADLARALSVPLNRINELVKGKRGITAETAILLSQYFGTSAQLWMNLQAMHDLTKEMQVRKKAGKKPVRPLKRSRHVAA